MNRLNIPPIEKGQVIDGWASMVAHQLFKDIIRDTGLPYTQQHLTEVALLISRVTIPSLYQKAAIAGGWLHDACEDIKEMGVFDPFIKNPIREKNKIYLNDLLAEAGEEGKATCFITNLMTHRLDQEYIVYVNKIFTFPDSGIRRALHILTGIVKMADRNLNINPDESRNINKIVREYFELEGANEEELTKFYKKTKTIDAFIKNGEINLQFDVGLFSQTLRNNFDAKQRTTAIDNLSFYLPLAETRLLVEVGEDNGLFDYGKGRKMLKDTYIDSLKLYPGGIHEVKRMGLNHDAPQIEGYTPILKEVRSDITNGKLKL